MENQIVIYQSENGQTSIEVRLENENVWLTTDQMSVLFEREESNIRRHIINVFKEGELSRENNVHFLHVNGVKKPVPFYNLNNGILYREDGSKRIADNTLVALTLMIAESKPEEKDVMVKVVVNLINQKN